MEQAGFVLTRSDLIRQALGADYLGLERTLDSHIRNLRRKLEVAPARSVSIATIYGVATGSKPGERMNRLWVRISLVIGCIAIFIVIFPISYGNAPQA